MYKSDFKNFENLSLRKVKKYIFLIGFYID